MTAPTEQRSQSGPYAGLNYRSARRVLAEQFRAADLSFADEDALDLLLGLTGLSRTDYTLRGKDLVPPEQLERLFAAANRRLGGEPVDRILGWREFYGRRFAIEHVLSPRGDTEVLLLAALEAVHSISSPILLDLGTGSGALAVSILCKREDARAWAVDHDEQALETTQRNAQSHGVTDRLTLIQSDWFDAVPAQRFDAVLSNPPYIDSDAMQALEPEVADHDPDLALHGGADGLDAYRIIIPEAGRYLKPGGWLGVEIGFDQGLAVRTLFETAGYSEVTVLSDPAGYDRVIHGRSVSE